MICIWCKIYIYIGIGTKFHQLLISNTTSLSALTPGELVRMFGVDGRFGLEPSIANRVFKSEIL